MVSLGRMLQNMRTLCKVIVFCSSTCCGSSYEGDPVLDEGDAEGRFDDTDDEHDNGNGEERRPLLSNAGYGSIVYDSSCSSTGARTCTRPAPPAGPG